VAGAMRCQRSRASRGGAPGLELGARIVAGGLGVGVAEHVGDEGEVLAVVAYEPCRECVRRAWADSSTPAAALI
jgi:hypothetical protein